MQAASHCYFDLGQARRGTSCTEDYGKGFSQLHSENAGRLPNSEKLSTQKLTL